MSGTSSFIDRLQVRLASPWALVVLAFTLAAAIIGVLLGSYHGAASTMTRILTEKGASLIRSLEAGARTGMRHSAGLRLQVLLEEMADQPDIRFIAVVSPEGEVLAHSDVTRVGTSAFTPESLARLDADGQPRWRILPSDEGDDFVVYRRFEPVRRERGGLSVPEGMRPLPSSPPSSGRGDDLPPPQFMERFPNRAERLMQRRERMEAEVRGGHGSHGGWDVSCMRAPEGPPPVILVGLDMRPFIEASEQDRNHVVLMLVLAGGIGAAGIASLVWSRRAQAARRRLMASQAFAAKVVSSLPDGLVALDRAGRIDELNAAGAELLGLYPAAVLGATPEVLPAPLGLMAKHLHEGGVLAPTEVECRRGEHIGHDECVTVPLGVRGTRIVDEEGRDVGVILLLRDLREVRHLEAEVRRREKLAAVGNLAAGVAHEIRNPLSSIKGYATYFGTRFPEGSEDREAARVMVQEVDRLNRVISDLIGFSRPSDIRPRPTRVADIAEHALRLVRQDAVARGVQVRFETAPDVPEALLDPDRFAQALLNVCINGMEAMHAGGLLTVAVRRNADGRVAVTVSDTGPGIEPENLSRVFDPYFTTKGQGTGLGLAIVHKIIEAHDGEVVFRSEPGKGTECTFLLPAASLDAESAQRPVKTGEPRGKAQDTRGDADAAHGTQAEAAPCGDAGPEAQRRDPSGTAVDVHGGVHRQNSGDAEDGEGTGGLDAGYARSDDKGGEA